MNQREPFSIPLVFANQDANQDGAFVEQPFSVAAPFSMGAVNSTAEITLKCGEDTSQACTIEATGFWPDNSIKWCVLRGIASAVNGRAPNLSIEVRTDQLSYQGQTVSATETQDGSVSVLAERLRYDFSSVTGQYFPDIYLGNLKLVSGTDFSIDFTSGDESDFAIEYSAPELISSGFSSALVDVCLLYTSPSPRDRG